jgi:putative ABC transport system substrate-binding protein
MNNRRRRVLVLGVIVSIPRIVFAQAKQPVVVIGWFHQGSRSTLGHLLAAFKAEMAKFGWAEGDRFVMEDRWADGRVDRVSRLAVELAATKPAVIVAGASRVSRIVARSAPNTPIVQISGDPVAAGLAASLARPGGMVTGVTNIVYEISQKRAEFLLDALPAIKRIGFLIDGSVSVKTVREIARRSVERYPVEAHFGEAAGPDDIEPTVAQLAKAGAQALIVMPGFFPFSEHARIVAAAQSHRLPVVTGHEEFAKAGALITYGNNDSALARRAAYYVDRILKGAKPGDLPIEQPMTLELIVNLKTARALGLTLPRELLVRADRVIQ